MTKAPSHRTERIGQLILQELGQLLVRRVKDPVARAATLTEVRMSPDLTLAKVYVAASDEAAERTLRGLERASGFLRREVGASLHLKRTPELRFLRDEAIEEGDHIDGLLREIVPPSEGEEEPP